MIKNNRFFEVKRTIVPILVLLFFCGNTSWAQRKKIQNLPKYNQKRMHFGFSLGINYLDFHVEEIPNLSEAPGYYNVSSEVSPGYNVNIITNLRLSEFLDLRFNPGYASSSRKLFFDILNPVTNKRETIVKEVSSSIIEFPFELKLRSERVNNYGMYVFSGVKFNKDLASNEDAIDDRIFKIKSNDLYYELGVGIEIYFEYFKFSPQIKGSFGFADIKVEDGTFLVQGINRLESRCILINFTFE